MKKYEKDEYAKISIFNTIKYNIFIYELSKIKIN